MFCNKDAVAGRCPTQSVDEEDTAFSLDRTLGVAANQICGGNPTEVASLLDAVGLTPNIEASGSPVCTFGNTEMIITCNSGGGGTRDVRTELGVADRYSASLLASVSVTANAYFASSLAAANNLDC